MKGRLAKLPSNRIIELINFEIEGIEVGCIILTNTIYDLIDYHKIEAGHLQLIFERFNLHNFA